MCRYNSKDTVLIYVVTKEYQNNYYGLKIKIRETNKGINFFLCLFQYLFFMDTSI